MTRANLTPDEDRDLEIAMEIGASACDRFLVAVAHKAEHDGVDPLDAIYSLWCTMTSRLLANGLDLETAIDSVISVDRHLCGQEHLL